jgi:hypothetical protein
VSTREDFEQQVATIETAYEMIDDLKQEEAEILEKLRELKLYQLYEAAKERRKALTQFADIEKEAMVSAITASDVYKEYIGHPVAGYSIYIEKSLAYKDYAGALQYGLENECEAVVVRATNTRSFDKWMRERLTKHDRKASREFAEPVSFVKVRRVKKNVLAFMATGHADDLREVSTEKIFAAVGRPCDSEEK